MNNFNYFKFSQTNDDEIVDFSKAAGVFVITKNKNESQTELMKANHRLTDLITTYKTIKDDSDETLINKVVDKIINIIETVKLINYTPFCVYFQVIGYSYSSYIEEKDFMTLADKRKMFRELLDIYIFYRHDMYNIHGYSDQVLQVQSDAASSRRKGKVGIEKLEEILLPYGFEKANTILDLEAKINCYILPDKGDKKLFDRFLRMNKIRYEFRETRDGKYPDMLLKIKGDYYILEHKLTNGGGGSQNAEINEIIQFVGYSEVKHNWHYISCLQGNYFKRLNSLNKEPKIVKQYGNVTLNLRKNPKNYFVNGKGFEKLIKDLC